MKMKVTYFNSSIILTLITLAFLVIIIGVASAEDEEEETLPDLVVEILCDRTEPEPGETVNITITVKNQGMEKSGTTNLMYITNESSIEVWNVSSGLVYHSNGIYDGNYTEEWEIPELDPASNSSLTFAWTPETEEETLEVRALVDPDSLVNESEEENNEDILSVTSKRPHLPDLVIEGLYCDPTNNPEPGQKVNVRITVTNSGRERSGKTNLAYEILGSYTETGEGEVPELNPGQSYYMSFPWTPETQGIGEIKAKVDADERVDESNEGNNEITRSVTVEQKLPDLVIEEIYCSPSEPKSGEAVNIELTVKNSGTGKSGKTNLAYEILGSYTETGEGEVPELDPGKTHYMSFQWTPETGGTGEITAKVDADELVDESNEENNEITRSVTVEQKLPDLVIEEIYCSPAEPKPGDSVNIIVTVRNDGTDKSGSTNLAYEVNGSYTETGEKGIPPLDPKSSHNLSFSWTPETAGDGTIWAKVDADEIVQEINEENNEKTYDIIVEEQTSPDLLPDLVIEELFCDPVAPESGETVNITATVKNQGTGTAGSTNVTFYINEIYKEASEISELNPGSESSVSISWIPETEETAKIRAHVDAGNYVEESDDENNEFTKDVLVNATEKFPDLSIGLSWTPQKPEPNESVSFTVTIKNEGPVAAEASTLEYYINETNETYKGSISIAALPAGEKSENKFTWVPEEEGTAEVKAIADSGNSVQESSETNNEITKSVTVSEEETSSGSGGSSSSSSSSGSAGGGSREPARNVEIKELSTRYVISGYHVRYEFPEEVTCITYIEFDPKYTFKKTTTIVEMLKEQSVLVPKGPPGRLYKNLNIWVGERGAGFPETLDNGFIGFKVEKAWIENNNINESLINLLRYDGKWNALDTEKTGEDEQYLYFKAATPGFSPFAITEYTGEEETAKEEELKEVLTKLREAGKGVLNGSAEKEENDGDKNPFGKAKVFMAITLPLFMILVEFMILKKKS